ncbi:hypothetical protein F0562_012910 [Nyssa sinensis]|uniref:Uncharacterized protein n=1 Tax=Nyssa sinensis TaxID=561372 RepID=A0A5J4ZYW1_9ASTE|nr:hypothetical protein F0562_012910 [Nyssa sinensis]
MPSPILILLLCLCVHACNARHLYEKPSRVHLDLNKDVDQKAKLHKTLTPSSMRPSISVELQTGENFIAKHDEIKPYKSWSGANTVKQKPFKTIWKEDTTEATSVTDRAGTEILASSLLEGGLQQATKVVGWKRQARSMLVSTQHDTKETVNSEENDVAEDIVVMDYAQPHRKPPIHNKEP